MIQSPLLLDIPSFVPEYQETIEYGYKNKPRENLEKLLRKTSKNHCMYCYCLLQNDRVNIGNLEHSIEKSIDEEHLTDCVPNISITCPYCNQSLKRIGEKKRVEAIIPSVKNFTNNLECKGRKCKSECANYKELKSEYCRESQIILQPMGVKGEDSGQDYRLQYDVEKAEFIPSKKCNYDEKDIKYINHHINRFKLNDRSFKTKALVCFVEDVVEAEGRYRKNRKYSNYIVDLFKESIQNLSREEVLELCEQISVRNFLLFRNT
ncbi:MAG: hypothetical protein JTJ28_14905 [Lactobacillus sp.]|nr:hypothetical protein [Lactobacillus sp.]